MLCSKSTSRTVRKLYFWALVRIAPVFVIYYGYSLRGVSFAPLRPLETFSGLQHSCMGRLFLSNILPNYWKFFEIKI